MKQEKVITVTPEHIQQGRQHNPNCCPIALALQEALGTKASVGLTTIAVGENYEQCYSLPWEATQFIDRFDYGGTVQGFSFVLDMEPRSLYLVLPEDDEPEDMDW